MAHKYIRDPFGALVIFSSIALLSLCVLIFLPHKIIRQPGRLYVVCTTGIVADMVARIGGDCVCVDTLMGPGVDPHSYRARESDMHKLAQADIVFYHGLHLEGKMASVFEQMNCDVTDMVNVSEGIPKEFLRRVEGESVCDPHVWHEVRLWRYAAACVGNALAAKDSVNKKVYETNTDAYLTDLDELDAYIRTQVALVPLKQRILITAHDAFSYFGQAYGFEVVGLQGISTDSEISTHDIRRVVDVIIANNVPALFVESLIPQRTIQAVKDAVNARGKQVAVGDELYSDALGDAASGADTYISMIKHNVDALVRALGDAG